MALTRWVSIWVTTEGDIFFNYGLSWTVSAAQPLFSVKAKAP